MKRKLISWPEVFKLTNLARSTAWRQEERGLFPARIIVGFNSVRWDEREILEWLKVNHRGGVRGRRTCKNLKHTYQSKTKAVRTVTVRDTAQS